MLTPPEEAVEIEDTMSAAAATTMGGRVPSPPPPRDHQASNLANDTVPLTTTNNIANPPPQPATARPSWWTLLKQEIRREEHWSWLPTPPRRHLINFKGQDHAKPSTGFILWRVGTFVYWTCWLSVAIIGAGKGIHLPPPLYEYVNHGVLWLIFSTNWTAMVLWCYLLLACLTMVVAARAGLEEDEEEPYQTAADDGAAPYNMALISWLATLTWVLRDTVAAAAVMVMLLYWLLLFPLFLYTNFVDVHLHLINALIVLVDLWLSRLPYWLLHFPAPMLFLCVYILFSGIYYAAGGKAPGHEDAIYPWLDYDRLEVTVPIIFLVAFVIFPLVHVLLWAFERQSRQRALRKTAAATARRQRRGRERGMEDVLIVEENADDQEGEEVKDQKQRESEEEEEEDEEEAGGGEWGNWYREESEVSSRRRTMSDEEKTEAEEDEEEEDRAERHRHFFAPPSLLLMPGTQRGTSRLSSFGPWSWWKQRKEKRNKDTVTGMTVQDDLQRLREELLEEEEEEEEGGGEERHASFISV